MFIFFCFLDTRDHYRGLCFPPHPGPPSASQPHCLHYLAPLPYKTLSFSGIFSLNLNHTFRTSFLLPTGYVSLWWTTIRSSSQCKSSHLLKNHPFIPTTLFTDRRRGWAGNTSILLPDPAFLLGGCHKLGQSEKPSLLDPVDWSRGLRPCQAKPITVLHWDC